MLVEQVEHDAAGVGADRGAVDGGAEHARGVAADVAVKDDLDVGRAADVKVVGDQRLEERPRPAGRIQHEGGDTSTWRIEISHQYPACWSLRPNGSGSRCSHRWANTSMVPGRSRSQISCKAAGSSQAANPLDSSVKLIPALAACRLAHSW